MLSEYPTQELIALQFALSIAYVESPTETIKIWSDRVNEAIKEKELEDSKLPEDRTHMVSLHYAI